MDQGSRSRSTGQGVKSHRSWDNSQWSMVTVRGHWSENRGHWLEIKGHWSRITGEGSEVRVTGQSQGSLVSGQRSVVKGHWSNRFLSSDLIRIRSRITGQWSRVTGLVSGIT